MIKNSSVLEGIMEIIQGPVNVQERTVKYIHQVVSKLHCGKLLANTDEVRYQLLSKIVFLC